MYLAKEDGQKRFPLLHQRRQDAVHRRLKLEPPVCAMPRSQPVGAALPAEGGFGHRTDHGRRSLAALDAPRTRRMPPAQFIPLAEETGLMCRSAAGIDGSLRPEHGVAAPRIAADRDGGQPLAKTVRR